jgi:hypothetical protein
VDVNDSRGFYDAVKLVHGPTSRTGFPVRSADGATLIRDNRLILNRWAEHFSGLINRRNPVDLGILGSLPEFPTVLEMDNDLSIQEISMAVNGLNNRKAPGSDGIPAEVFRRGGYMLTHLLHQFCSIVWLHAARVERCRNCHYIQEKER